MKKFLALAVTGVLAFGLVGCGGSEAPADSSNTENTDGTESESGEVTLKIGASPTPHAEILAAAKDTLAAEGITLDIIEFNDYVQPNLALESGDLDANFSSISLTLICSIRSMIQTLFPLRQYILNRCLFMPVW